ncbi:mediator of RNA polymerase II transcription subunit 15 [Neodiprion pinetum]|uniref:mediator of RNA polymerase II transcription subunit 15 n=1 Tax=Neodiprion pinetum TaxID=441929 RepID=UPI001EE10212|nr:putative mediator of RNA polymerase II transcription subunit 26 [Neodiprion pinetum]
MHLQLSAIFLAVVAIIVVATEGEVPIANDDGRGPPVKLDKNLRRALLKALADLEAESAEQRKNNEDVSEDFFDEGTPAASIVTTIPQLPLSELNKNYSSSQKSTISFNGFLGEGEFPNEEKLQNSTFVEVDKYTFSSPAKQNKISVTHQELKSPKVHDLISAEKSSAVHLKNPLLVADDIDKDQGTRSIKNSAFSVNSVQSVSSKPTTQQAETLSRSASNNIAAAENSLVAPRPTASSLTSKSKLKNNSSSSDSTKNDNSGEKLDDNQEVKIFQAPLVAAFTVQQDERGIPKSVVPIYRASGDGQALTLQEQLEFKQQQLEKQLAELQRQQLQQTQFLARQQQLYEEQLRFKQQQQQQIFLREQARLKQLEEQRIYQQQIQQQQHQQRLQQANFDQNSLLTLQSAFDKPGVQLEPSVSLQLPSLVNPPSFQNNYQEQRRLQQLQQQQQQQQRQRLQQQQQQQQQQQLQQQLQQQQILQQSFGAFPVTEFQTPAVSVPRFNRQELFGSTGNFGFNDNNNINNFNARGNFGSSQFNAPSRNSQNFGFNGFNQFRETRPQTPARQIQHLLYQSGVASDLGNTRGSGSAEDLNIVSKVLALNVGALPSNSIQFGASKRVSSFAKPPNDA